MKWNPLPKKHKYVQLIEFVLDTQRSFTIDEACAACKFSPKEFQFIAPSIFVLNAHQEDRGLFITPELQDWVLKPEAYFSYLQFIEFQYAVSNSRRAHWISVVALLIAIISLIVAAFAG